MEGTRGGRGEVRKLAASNPGGVFRIQLELRKEKKLGAVKGEGRQEQHPEAEGVSIAAP